MKHTKIILTMLLLVPLVVFPIYTASAIETSGKQYTGYYDTSSAIKTKLIARYDAGLVSAEGGSAEITAYNSTNGFAYSVNGAKGTLELVDMREIENGSTVKKLFGTELKAAELAENADDDFTYGDMTSVAVSPDGKSLAVAMQDADYTRSGRVLFFNCNKDGSLTYSGVFKTGIQPDMVIYTEDGTKVLTADEGEPRQGYTASGAVDPMGNVTVIDVLSQSSFTVDFKAFDEKRSELVTAGIILKKNTNPSVDFEPEYISVSGKKAYVALQEANAIAVLNLETLQFENVYSLGYEDYSKIAVDLNKKDEAYAPETYDSIRGIRMPDGIATVTIDDQIYLLTANEGDSRAWPADVESDVNEIKSKTSPVNGIKTGGKVTWFDVSQYDGLESGMDYIFGGRSFTMFKVNEDGLEEVFDSGSDFERITGEVLSDYFNCSNDTVEIEDRSGKKGPEPENITVGTINGHIYAFIGLERISGVMIYDITDPSAPVFKNYFNSRDFSNDIKDDVSPEGLFFVSGDKNNSKAPLLIVSNEVSGTVSVAALDVDTVPPEILNIENGKTYYVTKKIEVYNDDGSPITVTLNDEPVENNFYLPGNCEATYTIRAKDSVGNETVCTVYMQPISSITNKLGDLSENNVTSDNRALIRDIEIQLKNIADSFDKNESKDTEWNEIKDALNRCEKLQTKIEEISEKIQVLRAAIKGYSSEEVGEEDRADLEKLVLDAKALISSGNLTKAEKEEIERMQTTINALLGKIEKESNTSTQSEKTEEDTNKSQDTSNESEKSATETTVSPKTGDSGNIMLGIILFLISVGTLTVIIKEKRNAK